jgi:hypothetical protein
MHPNRIVSAAISMWLMLSNPDRRDERGGSSGTIETLLLIALAIAVVALAAVGIRSYVSSHLP